MLLLGCDGMTKDELIQCRNARIRINKLSYDIAKIRASAGVIGSVCYDSEPRSRGEPVPEAQRHAEKLDDLEIQLKEALTLWTEKKSVIRKEITRKLPEKLGLMIWRRYVKAESWNQINKALCIRNKDQSMYLHRKALKKLMKST